MRFLVIKAATLLLISASTIGAFAIVGDGKGKEKNKSLLTNRYTAKPGYFSLRGSKASYGPQFNHNSSKFIMVNATYTYQKGNATYIVPLKNKVMLNNVSFKLGVQNINK